VATVAPEQILEEERVTGPVPELQRPSVSPEEEGATEQFAVGPHEQAELDGTALENTHSATLESTKAAAEVPTESGFVETEAGEADPETSDADPGSPPPEPEPHPERSAALKPYFIKLHELLGAHRELENPSQLNIGTNSLHISIWERELALKVLDGQEGGQPGWVRRVAEGVTFQAKALVDLDRLTRAGDDSPAARERILHDLYLGAAIGRALHTEIQKTVDSMVVSGDMAGAKQLTQLHNRVKAALNGLRDVLDPDVMERSQALAAEMTIIPSDAVLPDPKKRRRRRRRTDETAEVIIRTGKIAEEGSRIKLMDVILTMLSIGWGYFVLMPMLNQETIPELSIRDFRTVSEVHSIVAKPPSLYVTVSAGEWDQLGESGRQWVVDATARIATGAGYSGAIFKTDDGRSVAQWMKKTGTKVYPDQPPSE